MTGQSYRVPVVGGDLRVGLLTDLLARLPGGQRPADILRVNGGRQEHAGSVAAMELRAGLEGMGVDRVA